MCSDMFMFNLDFAVHIISDAIRNSTMQEMNQFLHYVKNKFSEVLLPVESIAKQGLLGKGYVHRNCV